MSGGHSEGRPCGHSDSVEVVEIEFWNSGIEEIRDTAEITNVDLGSEDRPSMREPPLLTQREISEVNPPAIPSYLQDFFNNIIASVK
jgi:hypothetical protein